MKFRESKPNLYVADWSNGIYGTYEVSIEKSNRYATFVTVRKVLRAGEYKVGDKFLIHRAWLTKEN